LLESSKSSGDCGNKYIYTVVVIALIFITKMEGLEKKLAGPNSCVIIKEDGGEIGISQGAGSDISMCENPLYDVDIVMAGTEILNLKYLIRKYKPDVMILYETLANSNKINELRYKLGFDSCFAVDRDGRGGGVAVYWNNHMDLTLSSYSLNHVDIEVADSVKGNWRLTGFYGYPERSRRRDSWNFLCQLSHRSDLPWCIIGDFNDILSSDEKKGRADRENCLITGFREAVLDAGLFHLFMHGYQFTWFKSLGTERAVEEKLDRALASDTWSQMFPNARLECLTASSSDHYPLWLACDSVRSTTYVPNHFKFEMAWLADPSFDDFVRHSWGTSSADDIMNKLNSCASDLTRWSKDNFHNLHRQIDSYHKKLERARNNVDEANINYFNALKRRLTVLLTQEDRFWRQRAKTFWYKDGDLNTKFFHAAATLRKKVNRIEVLTDNNNVECRSQEGMVAIARDYFLNLFQKQSSARDAVLNAITPVVTNDDNDKLIEPFVIDELGCFSS
ncbi:endonuclease/exonuclease/phosphatase family protein, partial [Trifolium medium]|nr:endonuclease/exonuclease/phosphatase family protein [Trifolium medium]